MVFMQKLLSYKLLHITKDSQVGRAQVLLEYSSDHEECDDKPTLLAKSPTCYVFFVVVVEAVYTNKLQYTFKIELHNNYVQFWITSK